MTSTGDRLVRSPVFIMCSVRSGSTLLRCLLGAHSQIHAPHELHLGDLRVDPSTDYARHAMRALHLTETDLEHLLWDRVLHRELTRSGKQLIVDKTPSNALIWRRIHHCWPHARYLFLLRHPAHIAESAAAIHPDWTPDDITDMVARFTHAVQDARTHLPGHTTRYEDLVTDPAAITRDLCAHLDVPWEPDMLHYGHHLTGPFEPGIGDWGDKIRSGHVQPGRPPPQPGTIPTELQHITATWGYMNPTTQGTP